ncbi:Ca2+-binding EF-hand superfamily protein [Rhizobium skierniewicense]|uniref:Ca2+-binding EF-hand superfamily protein n=1 Tax=Rhizobium skierniewicense TaxID=984260 RepID=A0A7W6CB59_9HYPH|nr:EF-hand domain-containing protein [Rhizobium skierniewicense]MBB3946592.1 Ca2+-binding EF-hand superfamily protein [Rhizobium skierniewicense]
MTIRKFALTALGAALVLGTTAPMSMAAPRGPGRDGPPMRPELAYVYLLKMADTNKDGKVSKEEFAARQDALFTEIDASKDGSITPKEMRDYRRAKMEAYRAANPRPEREDAKGPDGKKGGPEQADHKGEPGRKHEGREGGRGGMGGKGGKMNGMFAMADTDGNGQISKAEFTAAGEKMFTRLDKNTDGVISIDDMPDRPFL